MGGAVGGLARPRSGLAHPRAGRHVPASRAPSWQGGARARGHGHAWVRARRAKGRGGEGGGAGKTGPVLKMASSAWRGERGPEEPVDAPV